MDISKEYIKMCEKAIEIQSIFYDERRKIEKEDFINHKSYPNKEGFCTLIWLPRQDQLQEMVKDRGCKYLMAKAYKMFGSLEVSNPKLSEVSMELLWLTLVMKEKHNKTWDGFNWKVIPV